MNGSDSSQQSYYVIFNERSGTANALGLTPEGLQAMFEENGLKAEIDSRSDTPINDRIADAVASSADIIVAAGGDGTITALASTLAGTEQSLAILPLGTVNALAKDLNIPLDIKQAVAALATGKEQLIDVGEVNGRVFLHKVVVGVIPAVAAGREHIRGRRDLRTKLAFLAYFARRLERSKRMAVVIKDAEGQTRIERIQAIAVSSNAYDQGLGRFFSRSSLDQGHLTLYIMRHMRLRDILRLTAEMLLGRWHNDEVLSIESVQSISIDTKKSLLKVMFDGEVETLHTPLEFTIRKQALSVIVQGVIEQNEAA